MTITNKLLEISSIFTNAFCTVKKFDIPNGYKLIHSDNFNIIDFNYWKAYPYGYFKTSDLKVYWQSNKGMEVVDNVLRLWVEEKTRYWQIKDLPEYQRIELNYHEMPQNHRLDYYGVVYSALNKPVSTTQYDSIEIPYVSGVLHSIKGYRYGIFKIEAMFPVGTNLFPSFWLSGIESWPPEIDIFEGYNSRDTIEPNVHYGDCNENHKQTGATRISMSHKQDRWHEFVCWWEKNFIKIYYDGRLVYKVTDKNVLKWFDNKTMKVILNCNIDYWKSLADFQINPTLEPLKFRNFRIYQK